MAYRLSTFSGVGLDEALLSLVLDEHRSGTLPRLERLWTYYRNPLKPVGPGLSPSGCSRGWYRQAQDESQARRNVGVLFDDNRLNSEMNNALQKLTEQTRVLVIDLFPRYEIAAARFFFEAFIVAGKSPGVTHPAGMNDNGRQVLRYRF